MYIQTSTEGHVTNLLHKALAYVQDLAKFEECPPSSHFVCFLDKNINHTELLMSAQEALSTNKSVVIQGFVNTHGFQLTEDHMYNKFGSFADLDLETHSMFLAANLLLSVELVPDMKLWGQNNWATSPSIHTSLQAFLRDIKDPEILRVALDFPLLLLNVPHPFK